MQKSEHVTTSPSVLCFLLLVAVLASPLDTSISLQKIFFFSAPSTTILRGKLDRRFCRDSVLPAVFANNCVFDIRANDSVMEEKNV
jgi:hypothetical protein